ncbi:histidyl-tRNA synthetase [Desulfocucumis palustris]|uniref:Histidine--tRNA ligase n=1 Tax=Desulfocucumis palustris TaxID=1898651 RepID=A0A2L2XEY8_9FIRM|nr:histidine--tRNA ligase [Desulfocucumis palustris]GBF34263.1 histidyl-tRNA synthetase [Desulfocucumis palustris]
MAITRPRGTGDILPGDIYKWHYVEDAFRKICREYKYEEIRTPIFEHTELFERGVGDTTDIVEKEMYTFLDRGGRSITLRPENTAAAARAYMESSLIAGPQPVKLYYIGPMFRYDRPQAGRFRQFHQFGVEVFGANDPGIDAEVIAMTMNFYGRLGLKELELRINSVGCPKCRSVLREKLLEFFRPSLDQLCDNCKGRYQRNPLRILDCKSARCGELAAGAPTTLKCLCGSCAEHFEAVKKYLELLNIPYIVDSSMVRGLDYYTNTAFEIMAPDIGAQSSIGGGGRYNGLVEACGGPSTPGIGYALGIERIILTMERQGIAFPPPFTVDVFVAAAGSQAEEEALRLLFELRKNGISAEKDYMKRSLKAQMKYAGKLNPRYTVLLGGDELDRGVAGLKDMSSGIQEEVPLNSLVERIKRR